MILCYIFIIGNNLGMLTWLNFVDMSENRAVPSRLLKGNAVSLGPGNAATHFS